MRRGAAIAAAAALIAAWLGVAAVGGPYFGRLSQVTSHSATRFLPVNSEAAQVAEIQMASAGEVRPPAIIVVHAENGVSLAAKAAFDERLREVSRLELVGQATPLLPSSETAEGGRPVAYQAVVMLSGSMPSAVRAMRALLEGEVDGAAAFVAGPAGLIADMVSSFAGIDGPLLLVALLLVLIILVIVYRSPVLPFLVLLCAVVALSGAILSVYALAASGLITLEPQAQGILFILVVGAATDYSLLLIARYREELLKEEDHLKALGRAWRQVLPPVLASGATVIVGLLCLLLSGLNSNKAVGPVATAGVVFAMLVTLTLLPALLALVGRRAFYPKRLAVSATEVPAGGFWGPVANLVARRSRLLWVGTLVVLVGFAALAPRFPAGGTPQTEYALGYSEAREGEAVRATYFGAGSGTPTVVMATPERLSAVREAALAVDGVVSASSGGVAGALLSRLGVPGASSRVSALGREWAQLEVTLAHAEESNEATAVVSALREAVKRVDASALVGGGTATTLDSRVTARADLLKIVPAVLVAITLMLTLLLRSLVAPLLLVLSTLLSYLTTLGVAGLVFEKVLKLPPADASVPLFGFVFLVALGIDYGIFLTTRVREEALIHGTRPGVLRGLTLTGNVITSAGIALAATFAALAVIPVVFMLQIAVIVAFGVLLDTLVVRTLLLPSLLHELGPAAWWPRTLSSDA